VEKKLQASHHRLIALIEKHSDEALFTKKYYQWTKSTSLAVYFNANLAEHYQWAMPILDEIIEKLNE
jgi:hypothetical protein